MKLPDDSSQHPYRPGQLVPISGTYVAEHKLHRPQHEVLAIRGEEFPPCRICNDEVRFYISSPVPHMMHDFDLAGPGPGFVRRAKAAKKGVQ